MGKGNAIVEARAIGRKRREGYGWLFRGIDLEIRAGERLAITGPSGAGKTLLLRALALLDPIDEGEVLWRGSSLTGRTIPAYRREVMYLHQHPALPGPTVEESLRHPFEFKVHGGRRFDREHIVSLLQRLQRDETFLARSRSDLSGGESQIVALLRAIQLRPKVLLLDEPTASIDPDTARTVEEIIERWRSEAPAERTVVWVTHSEGQAGCIAERTLKIRAGRLEG